MAHGLRVTLFSLACFAIIGCGGPTVHEVDGEVNFDGKPVPAGRIYFNPDFTKGNDGPQGYAPIKDGKFDTRKGGKGVCGGATIVVIQGHAGTADPLNVGDPIFNEYQFATDLPRESTKRNFDVPKSAAENLKKSRGERQD